MKNMKCNRKVKGIAAAGMAIVLAAILAAAHLGSRPEGYVTTIKEIGSDSMLVHSTSEELGYGEILLIYDEDMVIRDVNGQELGLGELDISDSIRIEIQPCEKHPEYDYDLDPVVDTMILLPDESDDYI